MRRSRPLLLLLSALLVLPACTGGGNDSAETASAGDAATGVSVPDTGQAGGTTGGSANAQVLPRVAPRDAVIRTAELDVRVDDVRAAAREAVRLVDTAGGLLAAEDVSGTEEGTSALLQLRIPPAVFDQTLARLADLGEEQSRRVATEDVTEEVVDLEARLTTQRASIARVRALLDGADALGEVVQIEAELTKRTAELESLQARLDALTDRVDLSTVTLRLHTDDDGPVVGDALGFGDGLDAGWDALTATVRVLAVVAGAVLPFLPLVVAVGAVVGWRARSRRTALSS
jgi:hypothetical protein